MNIPYPFKKDKQNAQSMVEFALVLPLLLLILFGLMEFGRLLGYYVAVISASREAARYGSAAGDIGGYIAHYQDCDGIRAAGKRVGFFADLEDANFTIAYDRGSEDQAYPFNCGHSDVSKINLGDRVVVTVSQEWQPIVPLVGLAPVNLTSVTRRTILKAVEIEGDPPPVDPPEISFFKEESSCIEDTTCQDEMRVRIALSWSWTEDIWVHYSFSSVRAKHIGDTYWDYEVTSPLPLRIPKNTLGIDIIVIINPDEVYEGVDECIRFTLDEANTASRTIEKAGYTTHNLCIEDDEPMPNVWFDPAAGGQKEDIPNYSAKARLDRRSEEPVTVFLKDPPSGTATLDTGSNPDADYKFIGKTIIFDPYIQESKNLVNIVIINDIMYEDDETVVLEMVDANNAIIDQSRKLHTLTIEDDDDPPTVSFSPAAQTGGKNLSEMFVYAQLNTRSGKDTVVDFTINQDSTASYGADYTLDPLNQVTIPAGETSVPITITLIPDNDPDEPDETVILDIGNVVNATKVAPTQHIATIINQDVPPTVYFSTPGQSVYENAKQVTIRARLTFASPYEIRVPFSVSGTATGGVDYKLSPSSPLIFPPNVRERDFVVNIVDDDIHEDNETIIVNLGTPLDDRAILGLPRRHTVTILDDDQIPTVSFTRASQNGSESAGTLTASLQLSGASGKPITVPYTVSGTATAGEDYTLSTDSPITFAPGVTSADIVVEIIDDDEYESEETVVLILGEPENALLGAPSTHTMYLLDNDMPVCSGIYTIGTVTVDKNQRKINTSLSNGSLHPVTITGITIAWRDETGLYLTGITFGASRIWPEVPESLGSTANITDNWDPLGDRSLLPGSQKNLVFTFTRIGGAQLRSLQYLNIQLDNGCNISKQ